MFKTPSRFLILSSLLALSCGGEGDYPSETYAQSSSFEDWRDTLEVHQETGTFVVEGDLLLDENELRRHFEEHIQGNHLILDETSSGDRPRQRANLTYCISNNFSGPEKSTINSALKTAVSDWSTAAKVTFTYTHNSSRDAFCVPPQDSLDPVTSGVDFEVVPLAESSGLAASAFLPAHPRWRRQLRIKKSAINTTSGFVGLMRHEVGHILGFLHEQVRSCNPDGNSLNYLGLTRYDGRSIMHYTNVCDQIGSGGILTAWDKRGAACAYSRECEWEQISHGNATDISIGAGGHMWAVGATQVSGGFNIMRYVNGAWQNVSGGARRISVDPNGNPWIVTATQSVYRWNGSSWVGMPGKGTDIAVGPEGSVWMLGTALVTGGYAVYRWTGSAWSAVGGAGTRIAVGPGGVPWITTSTGSVYRRSGSTWVAMSGITGTDIGVGANGSVWVISASTNNTGGGYAPYEYNASTDKWARVTGGGTNITVDPNGKPWMTNNEGSVYKNRWEPTAP